MAGKEAVAGKATAGKMEGEIQMDNSYFDSLAVVHAGGYRKVKVERGV